MKHAKKLLAVVLSMAMVIGCISVTAFGANTANKVLTSGGTYTLDGNWYGTTSSGTKTGIALTVNSGVTATVNRGSYQIYGKVTGYNSVVNNGTLTLNHSDSYVYNYSNANKATILNNGTLTLGTGTMVAQVTSAATTTPDTSGKGAIENNGTLNVNGAIVAGKITGTGTITKSITSGYFYDDLSSYCATGYTCVELTDAEKTSYPGCNYKAVQGTNVASVTIGETTTNYYKFSEAYAAAIATTTAKITLLADVSFKAQLDNISNGKTITLDLNGHTLSTTQRLVDVYGTFIIEDSSENADGVIEYTGSLSSQSVPFISATYGSGLGSGSVTLNSGTIRANGTVKYGNALIGAGSGSATKVTITGGTVNTNNKATYAVRVHNGTSDKNIITGGTIIGSLFVSGNGLYGITGGRFSIQPSASYITTGYQAILKSDGYYHVMLPPVKVTIGDEETTYTELASAFSYIDSKTEAVTATVTVSDDLEISSRIATTAFTEETIHNITLKLNDCTVTYTDSSNGAFLLRAYTYLTITGTGTIEITNNAYHFATNQNSKLTIIGGTFTNSSSSTNKYVSYSSYPNTTVVLDGGSYNYNPTSNAAGSAYKANASINDKGDGTYTVGTLLYKGGIFTTFNNIAPLLENGETITVVGDTTITNPVQFNSTGGVASSVKNITITDDGSAHTISVGITNCTTNAAFVVGAGKTLNITATAANNLHFKGYSGESSSEKYCNKPLITVATSGSSVGTLNLTNIEFSRVSNSSKGGCVYTAGTAQTVKVNVTGCNFHNNSASGGSCIYSSGKVTVTNSTFTDNSTTSNGTIYITDGTLIVQGTTMTDNKAKLGAAIYNYGSASTYINAGTTITDNTSTGDGGAVYVNKNAAGNYGTVYLNGANIIIKNNKKKTQSTQEGSTAALTGVSSDLNVNKATSITISNAVSGEIGIDFDQATTENTYFATTQSYTPNITTLAAFFSDEDSSLKAYKDSNNKLFWHHYLYDLTIGSSKTQVSGALYSYKLVDVSVTQDIHKKAQNIALHVNSGTITIPWNDITIDNVATINVIDTDGVGHTYDEKPSGNMNVKAISISTSDEMEAAEIVTFIKALIFTTAGNAVEQKIYAGIYGYNIANTVYFAGGNYTYISDEDRWDAGNANAASMNGNFPSILNQTENDIVDFIAGGNETWLAGVKAYDAWYWKGGKADGIQISANATATEGYNEGYVNWNSSSPFTHDDYERMYMNGEGRWLTCGGLEEKGYVVKISDSIAFEAKQSTIYTKDRNVLTAIEPSLDSDIAMTYYFTFSEVYKTNADAYVSIQVGSEEAIITNIQTLVAAQGELEEGGYGITVNFPPKMLNEKVTIKICDGSGSETTFGAGNGYNYLYYANQVIKNYEEGLGDNYSQNYSKEHSDMVKTLLHYGAAAQTQFSYNADNLADSEIDAPGVVDPTLIDEDKCIFNQSEGEIFTGAALVSDSMTGMRVYFTGSATTADVNGVSYDVQTESGRNYVEFSIAAENLARIYTVIVGGESCNINAYYVINQIVNNEEGDARTTAFRLFEFGEAAAAFYGTYAPSASISEALINTAYSYLAHGADVQYDQKTMSYVNGTGDNNSRRRQIGITAEEINSYKNAYLDCSSFIQSVLENVVGRENAFNSMGYSNVDEDGFVTFDLAEDKKKAFAEAVPGTDNIFLDGCVTGLCRWGRTTANEPTLAYRAEEAGITMQDLYNAIRKNLQPGDIVVKYRARNTTTGVASHGHVILWTGDGFIHCTGNSYDYDNNTDKWEENGSIFYVPASKFEEEFDLATFTKVVIYRPSQNMTVDMLTDYGTARQQVGPLKVGMTAKLTSGVALYEGKSVTTSSGIVVNFNVENNILEGALGAERTVNLSYTLPDGVTCTDSGGASVTGNTLTWNDLTIARGESLTKTIKFTVNADNLTTDVFGRELITSDEATGKGIATVKISTAGNDAKPITLKLSDIYVNNISKNDRDNIFTKITYYRDNPQTTSGVSGIQFVNKVLSEAGSSGVASDFRNTYTTDEALFNAIFEEGETKTGVKYYWIHPNSTVGAFISYNFIGGRYAVSSTQSSEIFGCNKRVRNISVNNLKDGDIIACMTKSGDTKTYTYFMWDTSGKGKTLKIEGNTCSAVNTDDLLDSLLGAYTTWAVLTPLAN